MVVAQSAKEITRAVSRMKNIFSRQHRSSRSVSDDVVALPPPQVPCQRARTISWIIPHQILRRAAFMLIHRYLPNDSPVAAWSQAWACQWVVRIEKRVYGPFPSRQDAIAFEKQWFDDQSWLFCQTVSPPAGGLLNSSSIMTPDLQNGRNTSSKEINDANVKN